MPLISVITTLYNYEEYIIDAIESFLIQKNAPDSEMIIVDDASIDHSGEVVKKYIKNNIKYIRLNDNGGYSRAKNVGIKASTADILVMLDADDMLTENSLYLRYNKIQEGFDFVHGPVLNMDIKNGKKRTYESKLWRQWKESKKDAGCYKFVHAQSVMLKKSIHNKIGLYDESLRSKSDREMWARIFNRMNIFKIGWVDDYVSLYRDHSRQMHKSKEKLKNNDRLQKEVLKKIDKRKKDLSGLEMLF